MGDSHIERRGDGTWLVTDDDGSAALAHAITDAEGTVWVHLAGDVFRFAEESSVRPRPRVHGHSTLEAPMPALVIAVLVRPGDEVEAGTTLLVLEAMKMELPIKAPATGRVEAVHCTPGQRVTPGRPLVDLAAPGAAQ